MLLISKSFERKIAIQILAEEYIVADNVTWMLQKKTEQNLKRLFLVIVKEAQEKNGAFLSENNNGVLLIYKQNIQKRLFLNFAWKLYAIFFLTGVAKGIKVLKWQKKVKSIRPKEGWIGVALAIQNDENKMKTAFEFKNALHTLTKNSKLPVYVETTVPRIKDLYESIGFEIYHKRPHDYANRTVWFLKMQV